VTLRPDGVCRPGNRARHARAPAPERPVPPGLPSAAPVARSMGAEVGGCLPSCRQSGICRRRGIDPDRSMPAEWSGRAAQLPAPVIDARMAGLRRSDRLRMDATAVPVPAPGTGAVRKDRPRGGLRDPHGRGGSASPIAVFRHAPGRGGAVARASPKGLAGGTLLVGGHTGCDVPADPERPRSPGPRPSAGPAGGAASSGSARTGPRRPATR
jgi:transposase